MSGHNITVEDLSRVLGCTQTTVWRWLAKPYKLSFRRSATAQRQSGRVHHYRLGDLLPRLRYARRGGLSEEELEALVRIDFQHRHHT